MSDNVTKGLSIARGCICVIN